MIKIIHGYKTPRGREAAYNGYAGFGEVTPMVQRPSLFSHLEDPTYADSIGMPTWAPVSRTYPEQVVDIVPTRKAGVGLGTLVIAGLGLWWFLRRKK